MDTVDKSKNSNRLNELQWCDHVNGDIFNVVAGLGLTYSCFATNSLGPVVVVGQGKVRVMCEKCFISKFGAFQPVNLGELGGDA